MPCYKPLVGWRSRDGRNEKGNWPVVFNMAEGYKDMEVVIPCGKCIGCRLERSKEWAGRCVQESKLWDNNYFLTLTYDDAHLPANGSLRSKDLQDFWKRLRKAIFSEAGLVKRVPEYEEINGKRSLVNGVRYFACGEYGDRSCRPHYHAICFNLEIPDLIPYKRSFDGSQLWLSNWLSSIWGLGHVVIGAVTFESCAYVARYVTKKIFGMAALEHYGDRESEFCRASNRPGIGLAWFSEYQDEVARNGFVLVNGHKNSVPRYYLKKLEERDRSAYLNYRKKRDKIAKRGEDNPDKTPERLADREKLTVYRSTLLRRDKAI